MINLPKNSSEIEKEINNFLEYLEVEKGSSPLTIRNYKHYLKRFCDWLKKQKKKCRISDINQKTISKYRLYLARLPAKQGSKPKKEALSRRTQGYHIIAIRSLLRWLAKNDYPALPADKLDIPKVPERDVKYLTGEQIDKLLNAPTLSKITGKRDKAILEVLFSTGLRVSELVKLNRDKVDFDRREFGIVGKGGKARVVFLSKRAADWVKNYLKSRKDNFEPIFIRHKGKVDPTTLDDKVRLTARSIQRIVKKYARKMKLPVEVTPHVLRHSFATDLLIAGADIRSVQEMLGHKNIQTTQVYTHVTHKHLKDVYDAFHGKGK